MKPGTLYRNGHGRCGCCTAYVDQVKGGRRERKREGWRFEPELLGWLCDVCSRRVDWFRTKTENRSRSRANVEKAAPDVEKTAVPGPTARGFGLKRAGLLVGGPARGKNRREKRPRAPQDRAQLTGKAGARANRPKGLHAALEPRSGRGPVRTLKGRPIE